MSEALPCALSIAGSDPTGGAGLELDLRVFQCHGVHGAAVSTALTRQTPTQVISVLPLSHEHVRQRLEDVVRSMNIDVIKVGMLGTGDVAQVVATFLCDECPKIPVVLDPVLQSSSGHALADDLSLEVIRGLLQRVTVVTPNREEAIRITGATDDAVASDLAWSLVQEGVQAAVVTGGDDDDSLAGDACHMGNEAWTLSAARVPGRSPHGTGCAFSSVIASRLALGYDIPDSIAAAKAFVRQAVVDQVEGLLVLPDDPAHPGDFWCM